MFSSLFKDKKDAKTSNSDKTGKDESSGKDSSSGQGQDGVLEGEHAGEEGAHSDHGSTTGLTAGAQRDDAPADGQPNEKDVAAAPLNKKQKAMKHFRKWWWAYLIGLIIFLAILLPILFELIIPAIVQDIVSSQKLPVHNGTLRAISPTEIEISLNSTLNTPIPARLGTFPLSLYAANATDIPFVNLTLPGQRISKNTPVTVVNQTIPISNETELIWWLNDLYDMETVPLAVKAHPEVFLGELHSTPHLSKTLELPGLNQLSGISIEGLELIYPPLPNGYNLNGTLNIPNAGVLGIGLGNISFNLMSGDINLGLVHLYDVTLQPGNTSSFFEGELYFDELGSNLGPVLQSQAISLGQGVITLNATGNSTMINGEHIKYVEAILNQKTLSLSISAVTLLSDVISGFTGFGNSSLINALADVFDNKTFFQSVLHNWDPPLYYPNETQNDTNARVKARRSKTRDSVSWNLFKFGMNMKRDLRKAGRNAAPGTRSIRLI